MDTRVRHKTKYPGVMYRLRPDGSRQLMYWFMGSDGKPHWKNFPGGERECAKERAKVIARLAHGEKIVPSRTLFEDFARAWLEEQHGLSPKSVETYRNAIEVHLIPRLGRVRISEVDVDRVASLIQSMQKDGKKGWTIRTTLTPLSGIMRTAVRRGLAPTNPVAQLDRSERPQGDQAKMNILDTNEIKLLLSHAGRWRTLIATAIFTGLRVSELLALQWEDVDWTEGVIHVKGTKTKAAVREVTLMPALQQILAKRSLEAPEGLVFQNLKGGPILRDVVRKDGLYPALIRAGIEKRVRFHDLRHTFASILISEGFDAGYVAEQMGHASINTTLKTYAKLFDGKKKREAAREKMQASFGQVLGQV